MTEDLPGIVAELDTLIRARYPIIAVETHEEERLRRIVGQLRRSPWHAEKGVYTWSRATGLVLQPTTNGPKSVPGSQDPQGMLDAIARISTDEHQAAGIFLLADFAPYLAPYGQEDPMLVRQLRELAWTLKVTASTIIISGPTWPEIGTLSKEVRVLELPLPDEAEVNMITDRHVASLSDNPNLTVDLTGATREQLTSALLGLTTSEIENALASATIRHVGLAATAIPTILEEKRQVIRASGSLTYTHPESADHLGGYAHIRRMLEQAAVTFSPEARDWGVEPSKGMLLVGLPGCGKDLTKKIASSILARPLLDLDFGSVMGEGGGVIGSGAMAVKRALGMATTLKGILGLSEFEKAVGGLESSGRTDGGETARTIGHLLNWMQEQDSVYVIATANDVRGLQPEQIRQGRFSDIAFVDLPTEPERADIFRVHLHKRGRSSKRYDLDRLAEESDGFSGAEVEAAVKGAILDAYMAGPIQVTDDHILQRVRSILPTSVVKADKIDELREWAKRYMTVPTARTPAPTGRRLEV